ncbi:methyltransferase domain-containing protein [Sinanaerobacter chloroacetimidivorans]|uniref:Arsenite methyltransferase n=1 Tax=Sinanaerobacter chloroacetimidivorans TaxID=2818044 RepID=A0A8J7W0F7_9FIRM|nr:methyltransferase domain-containing protein [Sinanaerobacter chloroacetimidivorans]MBR0598527.1 methyltransferase domain-containing protein [Sinanaerobacter chloroacetimidivorans]
MISENELQDRIKIRYEGESSQDCVLSCGNTLQELDIKFGEIILDLGCGRGEDTIEAAIMVGPEGMAIGLDLSEAMIIEAISRATNKKVTNAVFTKGKIESLPFPENSFDAVMSNCVINHAQDKSKAYREIHRVLIPNGRFVVADAMSKYPLPAEVKDDPEAWAQCFGGAITEEEYLDSILEAGFRKVEILSRREYIKNGYDFISLTIKAVK